MSSLIRRIPISGTGKSFLLHTIIAELRAQNKVVAVTASTGIAAEQIGARSQRLNP